MAEHVDRPLFPELLDLPPDSLIHLSLHTSTPTDTWETSLGTGYTRLPAAFASGTSIMFDSSDTDDLDAVCDEPNCCGGEHV